MIKCGLMPSKLDGTEKKINLSSTLLEHFSLKKKMPRVLNQGETSKCVAYSCANDLEFLGNVGQLTKQNYVGWIDQIYNSRAGSQDGMSIKEALSFIKKKIGKDYGIVGSKEQLKKALIAYGPCLIALPVYSNSKDFWNGTKLLGYHCVLVVGYDKGGFEIMNSWGSNWGDSGYTYMLDSDFSKIKECWCLIA